jgi:hypothetical protein
MPYSKRIDRDHPGCIVFLVDQSGSMNEPLSSKPGSNKAQGLADAVNSLLYELVLRCIKDSSEGPRHYYDIGVVGYGLEVGSAFSGALANRDLVSIVDLGNHPLRVEERAQETHGDTPTRQVKFPVWFEPIADGRTPMSGAIDYAGRLLARWVKANPESFPPIAINVSDGAATDGDPQEWAERLRSLRTSDGNALLFNVNLSGLPGDPVMFPASIENDNAYARTLFEMSSPLPDFIAERAAAEGIGAGKGARGFAFNADIGSVVKFLQIGTATYHAMAT